MLKKLMSLTEVTNEINKYKKEYSCRETNMTIFTQNVCGDFIGVSVKYNTLVLQVFESDDDEINETNEAELMEQAKKETEKIVKHYSKTFNVSIDHEEC